MNFHEQTVLITGASSGIGEALAKCLAQEGCKVGMIARREDRLREIAEAIGKPDTTVAYARSDVTDRTELRSAVGSITEQLGPIDLLVANAGVSNPVTLDPFNVEEIEQILHVNVMGVINSIDAVLPEMLRRGQGHLAAVSSLGGYRGYPTESAYSCSKAAVINFLEGLRIQLRDHNIDVTTICPGFIKTPMTEHHEFHMPGLMTADEGAERILTALKKRKKVYNFPWFTTFLTRLATWAPDCVIARVFRRAGKL